MRKLCSCPAPSTRGRPTRAQPARLAARASSPAADLVYKGDSPSMIIPAVAPLSRSGVRRRAESIRVSSRFTPYSPRAAAKSSCCPVRSFSSSARRMTRTCRPARAWDSTSARRMSAHPSSGAGWMRTRDIPSPSLQNGFQVVRRRPDVGKQGVWDVGQQLGLHPGGGEPVLHAHIDAV